MKKIILIIFLLSLNLIFAQKQCNCAEALQNLISKIENNYPGFEEKTKDTLLYSSLKEKLIAKSRDKDNPECLHILKNYTSFFKDGHIWILENDSTKQDKESDAHKILAINIPDFKKNLSDDHSLAGIWKDEQYTIGIKKTAEHQYTGFIISSELDNWKQKEIKFEIIDEENVTYYASDHSKYEVKYKLWKDHLLHIDLFNANFIKQLENQTLDSLTIQKKINELDGFYFEHLTDKTSLIKLSSFNYPYVERIKNLIDKNRSSLENSENLIIDIRNNGGGTDEAYKELLPLIVTNPVQNIGVELLSTQGLIDGVSQYKEGLQKSDSVNNEDKIYELDSLINIYEKNIGKFINLDNKFSEIDSIQMPDKSPKQIIILANEHVGSAAENFLLKAKQSKKVKVLGTPTAGVLDYANAYFFKFGCNNYKLLLPTYRSLRIPDYPIDNIGIQPDIYLDSSIKDWISYSIQYLEYKK